MELIAAGPAIEISSFYTWLQFGAVLIMGSLMAIAWRRRSVPGAVPFTVLVAAFSQWLTGIYLQFNTDSFPVKLFWINYYQLAIFVATAAWVMLTLQVSGYGKRFIGKVLRAKIISLSVVYLLTILNYRGLFLGDLRQMHSWFKGAPGPYFWVTWIVPLFWAFFGVACLMRQYRRVAGACHRQLGLLLLGIAPLVAAHGWIFWDYFINRKGSPEVIPLLFIACVASTLIFAWVIFRGRFFEIMQLAQAAVTTQMGDCLIAMDTLGYIADLNPAAEAFVGNTSRRLAGVKAVEVLNFWPLLHEAAACPQRQTLEGFYEGDEGKLTHARAYQIEIMPLANPHGRMLGKVILLHDITEQKQAQAQLLEQQKALAILEERDRLGRELHDDRGQIWSYFNMQLQIIHSLLYREAAAQTGIAPMTAETAASGVAKAARHLERLIGITKDLHLEVRESIAGLKNTAASAESLIPTLREHLAWFERNYGIEAQLLVPDQFPSGALSFTAGLQLLRIVQEALTNVRKHARAKQVKVSIQQDGEEIKVTIADDGCGFDPAAPLGGEHYGLRIIKERAGEAGGVLTIESQPGAGTKVIVKLAWATNSDK